MEGQCSEEKGLATATARDGTTFKARYVIGRRKKYKDEEARKRAKEGGKKREEDRAAKKKADSERIREADEIGIQEKQIKFRKSTQETKQGTLIGKEEQTEQQKAKERKRR